MLGGLFRNKKVAPMPTYVAPAIAEAAPTQPSPVEQGPNVVGSSMSPSVRNSVSVLSQLDSDSTQVLSQAENETKKINQSAIEPEQILIGLLYDRVIFSLFKKATIDPEKILSELQSSQVRGSFSGQPTLGQKSIKLLESALTVAKGKNSSFIEPLDILQSFLTEPEAVTVAAVLKNHGFDEEKQKEMVKSMTNDKPIKKSVLQTYGSDLTEMARQNLLDPVCGRDVEVERVVHILLRRTKNNPIVIGEAGVGKTAVVEGLAQAIVQNKTPKELSSKKIIQLEMSSLVAGASHRGEFEERIRNVIKEVQISQGQIILFVDEVHTLIGAGDEQGSMDASNIIKPYLSRGQIQIIGTTTLSEYRKHFQKDKAFERRFQPVLVEEPTEDVAKSMLLYLKPKYEAFHKVTISQEAIDASVHLSKRYIGERYLPDKAVDLIDEAAAGVKLEFAGGKRKDSEVKKSDIEAVISGWTGIPIAKLTEDESQKLLNLEKLIHKRLIGQEHAVSSIAEAVRRGRIGLASSGRPIASFIFLGPTGVGKTELAKTLAETLFGKDDAIIRLDMSEYMEKHEVAKLIGAPPGYVGYEEGGQLTEAVRRKPYSIVLLDEVEKAHPDVFNILLQVLEDGRLTDNKGNTVSFKNTILITTSNIGSVLIQQQLSSVKPKEEKEKNFKHLSEIVMTELHKFFKPELINRFDEVIIFEPIAPDHMVEIAKLGIEKTKSLLKEQGVGITITEKALSQLAKDGYDPVYGARPLRRLIQSSIENPVALLLIEKKYISGDTIVIDYVESDENFVFSKLQSVAQSAPSNVPQPAVDVQKQVVDNYTTIQK
ncbi:MAG: ATP-dependent Clp protease ATP-binding subunit [Microgenomates group bacterium]|nr:ATP-dependent Clp protease ATP-binding subunit [Candidatus Woesebacteria bacterium]MBP6883428.1 ATP-dependent Clp protease ATP-binding subunit [Candidatus Woesebacteria bacterium]QQR63829.1 MAG: ATP-dependent Clp protease ATP-binding subunit [Candidatus Roizmanbacteria bacterium]